MGLVLATRGAMGMNEGAWPMAALLGTPRESRSEAQGSFGALRLQMR